MSMAVTCVNVVEIVKSIDLTISMTLTHINIINYVFLSEIIHETLPKIRK